MSTQWENVVLLAREVDTSFASGQLPDATVVARLGRAILDFQTQLAAPKVLSTPHPAASTRDLDAAAE